MRAVLTRVKSASVAVDGKTIGQIGQGFLILLGITHEDTEAQAVKLGGQASGPAYFEDEDGKMNRGLETVGGEILVVSQFTLYGNCRKGRRPGLSGRRPAGGGHSPCMKNSWLCAGKRAFTPRPANSAPICWSNPSTTAP